MSKIIPGGNSHLIIQENTFQLQKSQIFHFFTHLHEGK